MTVFEELQARGLIAQATDPEAIEKMLTDEKVSFYIGFDPTADSLHVGHFLQMVVMSHLQKAGHTPIALFGGGTGMVGDPSGRTDMRKMLTKEQIAHNISCFQKQMSGIVDFSEGKAVMVNNADWLLKLNYIDFLREVGVHFSVNRMLTYECFKQRLERGLSFLEFNYMLMQSYDFLVLNRKYGCRLELGGDDQWSNIIGGVELVRKSDRKDVFGLTFTLLTTSDGKKMGKTAGGAVWLDPEKTKPYDFYQYWRNVDDADVVRFIKMLTFVPLSEIEKMEKWQGSELNRAKEILAYEVTKMVHGADEADKAAAAAKGVFGGGDAAGMPTVTVDRSLFADGSVGLLDVMVAAGLAPSKGEARRLVAQGGVSVNGDKASDIALRFTAEDFSSLVLGKGKKVFVKVTL